MTLCKSWWKGRNWWYLPWWECISRFSWLDSMVRWCCELLVPSDLSFHQRKKFMHDVKKFFWDDPYLCWSCVDGIILCWVPEVKMLSVLEACHSSPVGGHHSCIRTSHKILQCGFYWPTIHQDAHEFSKACDRCERDGGISRRQELYLNPILVIELFDVWGISYMGPFVSSIGYILMAVDYVSKWV